VDWKNKVTAEDRSGICLCGCGQKTRLAKVTRNDRGDKVGFPVRYVYGHNAKDPEWRNRVATWTSPSNWGGGVTLHQGYRKRHRKSFTENDLKILEPMFEKRRRGYILEHRAVVALREGRPLNQKEIVRHLDGNRSNNQSSNLLLGTSRDNFLDHDMARREVMRLKEENKALKQELWRLHGGPEGKVLWEGKLK